MKKLLIFLFIAGFVFRLNAYDKKSVVERFTNCSCGPCASINNAWYNATTQSLINAGEMTHIIYNGDWPSPGECDPMHLLNQANNNSRISYYGVNAVPWIQVNGINVATNQTSFTSAVTNGNSQFAPFEITLTPERFSNDVVDVTLKIKRDPTDVTVFGDVRLRVALTEKTVIVTGNPCCANGETHFYSECRTMLPNAEGTVLVIPAPGDSIELSLQYIPTQTFLDQVNMDSIRVVAFIQDNDTKTVYQSAMEDLEMSDRVNAAFKVDETMGAPPYTVTFQDYSTATSTSTLTSWEWDFDNDGTIDSNEPEPTWTYEDEETYSVKLTVSDGTESHTRTLENYITVLGSTADILVVNGINYTTYGTEMENFYNNSAAFGNHQVDVWDLFGDQGFDYASNPNIQQIDLFNRDIPNSILRLYQKVIWIGNNFQGDLAFFNTQQVLDYVADGGNFLLATRMANQFFDTDLKNYCGITSFTGDLTVTQLIALDASLVDMTAASGHTYVNFPIMNASSEAVAIFDDNAATSYIGGFRLNKSGEGVFIFIAGRPYRYDNTASAANYEFMIDNFMTSILVNVDDNPSSEVPTGYKLAQNYPNPFNPSTQILYSIPSSEQVSLRIYDVLGNEVATLVDGIQSAGSHSISFDASKHSSGIYFYTLKAGNFLETKKMILMK